MTDSQHYGGIMGIPERKEREKELRREEILNAAQKVFFEKDFSDATMDDIANAAEVSKGTVYLYFKSKEDIYLTVAMRGFKILQEQLERLVQTEASPIAVLAQLGDALIQFYHLHKNYFRMFFFVHAAPQFRRQISPEIEKTCFAENQMNRDIILAVFEQGIKEQLIRSDIQPKDLMVVFWSNAISMLTRYDIEGAYLKERFNMDLLHTFKLATTLILTAILTDKGRAEFDEIDTPQLLKS
jgi:AcrR family transcriptional regulator